ncbi:nuclear transport factor 2 family protein [Paraburkholderia sp. BCC1885]|jgi:ketosteroid isomerase-like protein|uniref:nuclear transport factor 2 family protein n=1 Tax=Paraburkholderia sp. BCC1885 TaxID=2562669 RepID=UPI0011827215|nr:nuclear transport factor 2 family protein [Paraburkholderia sp. BCC1885]
MTRHLTSLWVAALFATTGLPGPVLAQPPSSMTDQADMTSSNRTAVETMLNAWMAGDTSAFPALLSDDIEWTIKGNSVAAGTTHGRAELMAKVLTPFGARFAQSGDRFRPRRIHAIYADGDLVAASFDAAGIANDGTPYSNSYIWLVTMSNGKIVRATAFFDGAAFDDLWRRVKPTQN